MKYPVIVLTCIYIYLMGAVVDMSVQTTSQVEKDPSAQEVQNCVPTCKLFPALCKNNGKCRAKNGQDCKWFCECPPNCEGYFCEKVITEANKAGDNTGVQEKVVIEQKKKVDVSSFDKSKLAQALQNIYSKKKSNDEKPPEGPQIERIGKTLTVTQNVTGTIICPPELADVQTSNKTVNETSNGADSATIVPLGDHMHNSNGTTTIGPVSAANETTVAQTTVVNAFENSTTNATEADASTNTTTTTIAEPMVSSTTPKNQRDTKSSTDMLIITDADKKNKAHTAYFKDYKNKVKQISKIHGSPLRDKEIATSSVYPESTTQLSKTIITTASLETTTIKTSSKTTPLLSAIKSSQKTFVNPQISTVNKNESTASRMPATQLYMSTASQNGSTTPEMHSTQPHMSTFVKNERTKIETTTTPQRKSTVGQNESTTPGMPSTKQHVPTVSQNDSTKLETATSSPQRMSTVAQNKSTTPETTQKRVSSAVKNRRTTPEPMSTPQHTKPESSSNSMPERSARTESPDSTTVSQNTFTTNASTDYNFTTTPAELKATGRTENVTTTTLSSTVTSHGNTETIRTLTETTTDRIRESTTTSTQYAQVYSEKNKSKNSMHNLTPGVVPSLEDILGKSNTSNDPVIQLLKEVVIVGTNSIPETMNKGVEPEKTTMVASTMASLTTAAPERDLTSTGATTSAGTTQTPSIISNSVEKTDGLSTRKEKSKVKKQQDISTTTVQTTANLTTLPNSTQSSRDSSFTASSTASPTTESTVSYSTKGPDIILHDKKMLGIHQNILDNLKVEAQKSDINNVLNNVYGDVYSTLTKTAENKNNVFAETVETAENNNNLLADTVMPSS